MPLPTPLPILDARGRYLRAGVSFSRNSAKRVFDAGGKMVAVPANVPAWDCDPLTGAERGLLIEEARTNVLLRSEDFTTAWTSAGTATVTANATQAPDGALSADKVVEAATNGMHFVSQTITATVAQNWTATVFVKAAERTVFGLTIYDAANTSNNVNGTFNLASGTATPSKSGNGVNQSASIQSVGNGWYRCRVSGKPNTAGSAVGFYVNFYNGGLLSYGGDGVSGLYVWGAQLEVGGDSSSYIPTAGAIVTREADVCTMALGPSFNGSEGTVLAEFRTPTAGFPYAFQIDDGTQSNRHLAYVDMASATLAFTTITGGENQVFLTTSGIASAIHKTAYAWKGNSANFGHNGTVGTEDASCTMPMGLTTLRLGMQGSGINTLNGHLRQLLLYPRRLSNADLQAMTA